MTGAPTPMPSSVDAALVSRRRIAFNFLAMAGSNVLGLVITILVSVWVRRALGPEAIGQASWAVAAVAYLTMLVSPGLLLVGQRAVARSPERTHPFLALVLTVQTMLAAIAYVALLAVAWLEPRGPVVSVLLVIQGLSLFASAWNTGWLLQAHERMVVPGLAALVLNFLQLPVLMLVVHGPDDVTIYVAVIVGCTAAPVMFNVWYLVRCDIISLFKLRPTFAGLRGIAREAMPLALIQAAMLVIANTGILVLGYIYGDDAVGQFASAFRLMLVANVVTAALWNAYFPAFSRADQDPPHAIRLSRQYLSLLAWMGLPTAVLGWTFGGHVVELLYGPAFAMAGRYFEWLCLAVGFNFLNYGVASAMVPWGRGDLQFRQIGAAAVLNLLTVAVGVPLWGGWAAVVATVASEALMLVLALIMRRRAKLFWHPMMPEIVTPLLCSVVVGMALAAVPDSLDGLWRLQLGVASVTLALAMLTFERRALGHVLRVLRSR